MTREEAVELLCYGDWLSVISEHIGKMDTERIAEAMSIVGKALRPVSREQVERVWKRCEWCNGEHSNNGEISAYAEVECEGCDAGDNCPNAHSSDDPCYGMVDRALPVNFCPVCGRPLTDEAVEMVMERINEMEGTENGLG